MAEYDHWITHGKWALSKNLDKSGDACFAPKSGASGGHLADLGPGGSEGLLCGAIAGTDSGVDRAPMAGDISVFSGEVKGVFDRGGQIENGVERPGGNVAVGAVAEWIGLPVVRGAADELGAQVVDWERKDACQLLAG